MKVGDKVIFTKMSYSEDLALFTIGKVYTVTEKFTVTGPNIEYYLDDIELHVYPDQIKLVKPNNKLSRLVYSNMVESKCGKYLEVK